MFGADTFIFPTAVDTGSRTGLDTEDARQMARDFKKEIEDAKCSWGCGSEEQCICQLATDMADEIVKLRAALNVVASNDCYCALDADGNKLSPKRLCDVCVARAALKQENRTAMSIHINRPSSTRFQARVRWPGHRKYILIGNPTRSKEIALVRLAREFARGNYKRGDVLVTADYYDPMAICEIKKV